MIVQPKKEILRPYNKFWKTPFRSYSIDSIKLFVPVNPWELLYFLCGIIICIFLGKLVELTGYEIPAVIEYVVLPYLIMKFLANVKLDGKIPHKFFWDYFVYLVSPKEMERFSYIGRQKLSGFNQKIRFRRRESA